MRRIARWRSAADLVAYLENTKIIRYQSTLNALLVLRVLATLAVVVGHAGAVFGGLNYTQWPNAPYIQSVAVVVFFCVSGATIAWVLDTRKQTLGRFIFDRYMRLVIPLVPALILVAALEFLVLRNHHPYAANFTGFQLFGSLLFLQDLHPSLPILGTFDPGIKPFGTMRPLWTISIEFWTYIAFGGFVFALRKSSQRRYLSLGVGLLAVVVLGGHLFAGWAFGLPLAWFLGALTYFAVKEMPSLDRVSMVCLAPLWVIVAFVLSRPSFWPAGGSYSSTYNLYVFFGFILALVTFSNVQWPGRVLKFWKFMGGFAYTAYLVHYPLILIIRETKVFPQGTLTALVVSLICLVCSWALSLPFEQRYRVIRDSVWNLIVRQGRPRPEIQ